MSYPQSEVEQPPRHLKGFDKVYLQPGQTQTVEMHLVSGHTCPWVGLISRREKRTSPFGTSSTRPGASRKVALSSMPGTAPATCRSSSSWTSRTSNDRCPSNDQCMLRDDAVVRDNNDDAKCPLDHAQTCSGETKMSRPFGRTCRPLASLGIDLRMSNPSSSSLVDPTPSIPW
jgi:hypothetical protein